MQKLTSRSASVQDHGTASTFGVVDLKVITYNVYYENFNNKATLDAIGAFNADIVALQETNDKFEPSIEKHKEITTNFPHRYYAHDKWTVCENFCNINITVNITTGDFVFSFFSFFIIYICLLDGRKYFIIKI